MNPIRVLLADNNDAFLQGVSAWLQDEAMFDLVGFAHSGREAVAEVERLHPDLVLMDVAVAELNGFEATRVIRSRPEAPAVILLTFHESQAARLEAWSAGAEGCVDKARVTEQLMSLIRSLFPDRFPGEAGRDSELRLPSKQGPPRDLTE